MPPSDSLPFCFGYDPSFALNPSTRYTPDRPHSSSHQSEREVFLTRRGNTRRDREFDTGDILDFVGTTQPITSGWVYGFRALSADGQVETPRLENVRYERTDGWSEPPTLMNVRYHMTPEGMEALALDAAPASTPANATEPDAGPTDTGVHSIQATIRLPKWKNVGGIRKDYWYWFIALPDEPPEGLLEQLLRGDFAHPVEPGLVYPVPPNTPLSTMEARADFTFEHQAIRLGDGIARHIGRRPSAYGYRFERLRMLLRITAPLPIARARADTYERSLEAAAGRYDRFSRTNYWVAATIQGLARERAEVVSELLGGNTDHLDHYVERFENSTDDANALVEHAGSQLMQWMTSGPMMFTEAIYANRNDAGTCSDVQLRYVSETAVCFSDAALCRAGRDFAERATRNAEQQSREEQSREGAHIRHGTYVLEEYLLKRPSLISTARQVRSAASLILEALKFYSGNVYRSEWVASTLAASATWTARALTLSRQPLFQSQPIQARDGSGREVTRWRVGREGPPESFLGVSEIVNAFSVALDVLKVAAEIKVFLDSNTTDIRRERAAVFIAGGTTNAMGTLFRLCGVETLGRTLGAIGSIGGGIEDALAMQEAREAGDYSVAFGRALSGIGKIMTTASTLSLAVDSGTAVLLGTSIELGAMGPFGLVAAGLGFLGWLIYEFTQDNEWELVVRFSMFGSPTVGTHTTKAPHWAMGPLNTLPLSGDRQRRALYNLMYTFRLSTVEMGDVLSTGPLNLEVLETASRNINRTRLLLIDHGSFTEGSAYFMVTFVWSWPPATREPDTHGEASRGVEERAVIKVFPGRNIDGSPRDMGNSSNRQTMDGSRVVSGPAGRRVEFVGANPEEYSVPSARAVRGGGAGHRLEITPFIPLSALFSQSNPSLRAMVQFYLQDGTPVPACQCGFQPSISLTHAQDPVLSLGGDLPRDRETLRAEGHG